MTLTAERTPAQKAAPTVFWNIGPQSNFKRRGWRSTKSPPTEEVVEEEQLESRRETNSHAAGDKGCTGVGSKLPLSHL